MSARRRTRAWTFDLAGTPTSCNSLAASASHRTEAPAWTGAPCATLAAAHAALVERVMAIDGSADAASFAKWLADDFRCAPDSSGAWAVTYDTLAIDHTATDLAVTGRRALARYDLAGTRPGAVIPSRPEDRKTQDATTTHDNVSEVRFERSTQAELTTFDWSGDGRPEVFLRSSTKIEEGGTWPRASVWTYDGHAVIEYVPAKGSWHRWRPTSMATVDPISSRLRSSRRMRTPARSAPSSSKVRASSRTRTPTERLRRMTKSQKKPRGARARRDPRLS